MHSLLKENTGFRKAAECGEAFLQGTFQLVDSQISVEEYQQVLLPAINRRDDAKNHCKTVFKKVTNSLHSTMQAPPLPVLEKEISDAEELLQLLIQERNCCYQSHTVYVKYRSIVPISMFYEYLVSERCYSLKGPGGCYNLYEEELRYKRITDDFKKIVNAPEKIKENQYHLYQPLCEAKEQLALLCKAMGTVLVGTDQSNEDSDPKAAQKAEKRIAEYEKIRTEFYLKTASVVSELIQEREEAEKAKKRKEEEERLARELRAKKEQEEKEEKARKRKQAAEERKLQEEKQREAEEKQLKVQQQREEEDRIILAKKISLQIDSSKATVTQADLDNIDRTPVEVEEAQKIITNSLVYLSLMQKDQAPDSQRYLLFFVSETGSRISDERMMEAKAIGETTRLAFELKSEGGFSPKQRYYLMVADFDNFSLLGKIEFKINIAFSNDFGF